MTRLKQRAPRGLTLVEVLAVVVILGLVAGTLAIGFSGTFGKAKTELAKTGIGVLQQKLEIYRMERGTWPGNDLGLRALSDGQASPSDSFYVGSDQLLDPWGNMYVYATPGPDGRPYEVISYGSDGVPGGTNESSDVSSADLRQSGTNASPS